MTAQFKNTVLTSALIFFISYIAFLLLWIQVKDFYAQGITAAASKIAAGVKDTKFEEMNQKGDVIELTFSPLRHPGMLIDIPVKTSSYTFNAPLTFSIMATLYLFISRRKRAYAEALLFLAGVHLLYVFSLEAKMLTQVLAENGLEKKGGLGNIFYQFLWSFTDNMVIRFEPFLIGVYMFLRFRKTSKES